MSEAEGNEPSPGQQDDRCPDCGSGKVARILYGLPEFDDELERKIEAGEVVLGGCVITGDDPTRCYLECRHRWGR